MGGALPDDFVNEALYEPRAWFVQDVDFDRDAKLLVALCDTTALGDLVEAQRPWPGHARHFPGAIAVQITGTLGQLYANYVLDMRATDGWVGYGTHIHHARFRRLGRIGPPVRCEARLLTNRTLGSTVFTRFAFLFTQEGDEVYRSEQTAAWVRSAHRGPL